MGKLIDHGWSTGYDDVPQPMPCLILFHPRAPPCFETIGFVGASLLQAAYSDHQIGPFENVYQLVEDSLAIVGSGLEVILQYALRFAKRFKSQLLVSHRSLPTSRSRN
jgi:hypothetical protein